MSKSQSFRGLCPLDPRRGFAPGPHQGPLSGPLDPTPLYAPRLCSLRLNWSIFLALLSDQCFGRGYASDMADPISLNEDRSLNGVEMLFGKDIEEQIELVQ